MREYRQQALLEAPLESVWGLVGQPDTYPRWWPRVIEVRGERYEEGSEFIQVTQSPLGKAETTFAIDEMEDLRHIRMHCTMSGLVADWRLTPAAGGTFVEVLFGAEPGLRSRLYSETVGRTFIRQWLEDTVRALESDLGHVA